MVTKEELQRINLTLKDELLKLESGSERYAECHKLQFDVQSRALFPRSEMLWPIDQILDDCIYDKAKQFLNKISQL